MGAHNARFGRGVGEAAEEWEEGLASCSYFVWLQTTVLCVQQQEGCKRWQGRERKTHVRCACGTSSGFSQKEIDLKQVEVETKGESKCTAHLGE